MDHSRRLYLPVLPWLSGVTRKGYYLFLPPRPAVLLRFSLRCDNGLNRACLSVQGRPVVKGVHLVA